ncbi:MAG: hypothetical protein HY348_00950 [Nitrospira defluvii]|nr:hypothetical protein [Nitrospira defluvii]
MVGFLLTALLLTATPMSAAKDHAMPVEDRGRPVANEAFDKTMPGNLLQGLFNQALATLQEYVELEGRLPSHEPQRSGEFRLKLFPQGKSRSQEHLTAEGSFRLSPEADQQELTLRFKSSKTSQRSIPPLSDVL